jgi:16S rRNA (guanine527-N7)-methyltransferase
VKHSFSAAQFSRLSRLCEQYATAPTPKIIEQAGQYLEQLISFNRAVPLISRAGDPATLARQLFLTSLHVLPLLPAKEGITVCDFGSGGGFPAIPLKLARPDMRWVLVESKERKCAFLQSVIRTLELTQIEIVCRRLEQYSPTDDQHVSVVTSRAGPPAGSVLKWAKKSARMASIVLFCSETSIEPLENEAATYGFQVAEKEEVIDEQEMSVVSIVLLKKSGQ